MKILFRISGKDVWRIVLFVCKVIVVAVPVLALVTWFGGTDIAGGAHYGAGEKADRGVAHIYKLFAWGYGVSVVALLLGAFGSSDRAAKRSALIFAVVGIVVLLVLLIPATQALKFK